MKENIRKEIMGMNLTELKEKKPTDILDIAFQKFKPNKIEKFVQEILY